MEAALYSTLDGVLDQIEINNLTNTGKVWAYAICPKADYKLLLTTSEPLSSNDNWVFKLLDVYEEEGAVTCPEEGEHEDRDVPTLLIYDEEGDRLYSAKEPGRCVQLEGKLQEVEITISTNVLDCRYCNVQWLKIYLEKRNFPYDDVEYEVVLPFVMVRQ